MTESQDLPEIRTRDTSLIGAMVQSAVDGIIVINEQGSVRLMNPAAERLFGYRSEEVVGHNVSLLMPEPYRSHHDQYLRNYLQTGVRRIIGIGREVTGRRKDGSTFPMYLSVGEVSLGNHRLFTSIIQDLTERKLVEAQIARLQHRQELILKSVGEGILGLDLEGRISFVNPTAAAALGRDEEQLIGAPLDTLWPPDDSCPLYRVLEDGIICRGEGVLFLHRDGSRFPVEYSMTAIHEGGHVVGAVLSFQDISRRQQTAQEMQRMRSYLKNIIDSMPSVLVGVDAAGRVTEWNQSAEQASGISTGDARGQLLTDVLPYLQSQLEWVQQAIRNRTPLRGERLLFEQAGQPHYADVMVYPLVANGVLGAVIRVDDVTSRVRIEQMMVQTEKMLSVGGLAAGMAHEINNPLSAILQGCQNIQRRLSAELEANYVAAAELGVDLARVQAYLEKRGILKFLKGIQDAGTRATNIVTDMLAFSRRSRAEMAPTPVDEVLDTVIRLAASDYDLKRKYDFRQIKIVRDYDAELGMLYCDRTELEQVLLNLVRNAAQAMADGDTPLPHRIILRTRRRGEYALIEVEDNGPGMDEETRRRVFEPFYTTKPAGVGTGLGLSVSYFIITEQHQGDISVTSTPGQGTCFSIHLPLKGKRPAELSPVAANE
jgi:PAS domain S-box-containing protein